MGLRLDAVELILFVEFDGGLVEELLELGFAGGDLLLADSCVEDEERFRPGFGDYVEQALFFVGEWERRSGKARGVELGEGQGVVGGEGLRRSCCGAGVAGV